MTRRNELGDDGRDGCFAINIMQIAMTPSAKALSASSAATLKGVMVVPEETLSLALAIGLARSQEAEWGTRFAVAKG